MDDHALIIKIVRESDLAVRFADNNIRNAHPENTVATAHWRGFRAAHMTVLETIQRAHMDELAEREAAR